MTRDSDYERIHHAAARWASRWWISQRDFLSIIEDTRLRRLEVRRLRARGASRRIVARHQPFDGPGRTAVPIAAEEYDPWQQTRHSLQAGTRQVVECPGCAGAKKVPCPACGGSDRIRCPDCAGSGRTISSRSGKWIQCSGCRGKGERGCRGCRAGRADCAQCEGRGKVFRWLDLEEELIDEVRAEPRNALADALAGCSFDLPVESLPCRPLHSWHGAPHELPPELRPLARTLLDRFDSRHDRIVRIDFQSFAADVATVDYSLWGRSASVEVETWNHRVRDWPESSEPLRHRRSTLGAAGVVATTAGFALAAWYGGRHEYLASSPNFPLLFVLAALLGLALFFSFSRLGLAAGKGPLRHLHWLPLLLIAGGQVAAATTGYPSLERARRLDLRGDTEAARREAVACVELEIDAKGCAELHDDIRLAEVRAAPLPQDAWRQATQPFYSAEIRQQAERLAIEITLEAGTALDSDARNAELGLLLQALNAQKVERDPRLGQLALAYHRRRLLACAKTFDETCVRSALVEARRSGVDAISLAKAGEDVSAGARRAVTAKLRFIRSQRPVEEKLAACLEAAGLLGFLEALSLHAEAGPSLQVQVKAECGALKTPELPRKPSREPRIQMVSAGELEGAADPAITRIVIPPAPAPPIRSTSRDAAPLLCRDGTLSPTCVCGGPRRGCCSHHGGVAGCSQ